MQLAKQSLVNSWSQSDSPMVLGDIFSESASVAIWQREALHTVEQYFENNFSRLGLGIRGVYSINSLRDALNDSMPSGTGKEEAIEDIYLVSDMLTCLFDCDSVGLRLAPLTSAMCPRFHIDNIPVRLVSSYLGSGTEWLPLECLHDNQPLNTPLSFSKTSFGKHYATTHVQQMSAFDVGLLKGQAWPGHENMAAVHRSCQVNESEKRVLLTLDPM